jgi:thiamine kinase
MAVPDTLPESARALLDRTFGAKWRQAFFEPMRGATNLVTRVSFGYERYAVRVPHLDDTRLKIDRHSECAAITAAAAAGLAPEVVVCEPASGILITRWMETEVWTPAQAVNPLRLQLIAGVLRRLHELAPPARLRPLDLEANVQAYWSTLSTQAPALVSKLERLQRRALEIIARREIPAPRFCHNDVHCRNIIGGSDTRHSGETLLLDWEYSGLGEPLFDLASYSQSHDLNAAEQKALLAAYGATDEMSGRFASERQLFDWVCVLWMAVAGSANTARERGRFELLLGRLRQAWQPRYS